MYKNFTNHKIKSKNLSTPQSYESREDPFILNILESFDEINLEKVQKV